MNTTRYDNCSIIEYNKWLVKEEQFVMSCGILWVVVFIALNAFHCFREDIARNRISCTLYSYCSNEELKECIMRFSNYMLVYNGFASICAVGVYFAFFTVKMDFVCTLAVILSVLYVKGNCIIYNELFNHISRLNNCKAVVFNNKNSVSGGPKQY